MRATTLPPSSDPAPWVRDASDTLALAAGCYFSIESARRAIEFVERFCRLSDRPGPLTLMFWQRDFVARLFGWRRADGTRRFRSASLFVPKKNGKSPLMSAVALFLLLADGEPAPRIHINAVDREQASIVFNESAAMVGASPALNARVDIVDTKKHLRYPKALGRLQANSADVPSKDGANASAVIWDELHLQPGWAMWDTFRYAGLARRQPLRLAISTAGVDRLSVCWSEWEYGDRVASGAVADWQHLHVKYAAGEGDDWRDPAVWARANPSLGTTLKVADFEADVREVSQNPSKLNRFLRYRLNVWTQSGERYLAREAWDACGRGFPPPEWFRGRPCYAGLDLSSTTDLTAFVRLFRDGDRVHALCDAWVPEKTLDARVDRKDRVPWRQWVQDGHLRTCDGARIDYDQVRARVVEAHRDTPIVSLFADPWNAAHVLGLLAETDGVPVTQMRQGFASLNGPTKELEKLVTQGKFSHGGHPVLTWCADNADVEHDSAGNVKLSRRTDREKIDLLAATVNGLGAMLAAPPASVYSSRGILSF